MIGKKTTKQQTSLQIETKQGYEKQRAQDLGKIGKRKVLSHFWRIASPVRWHLLLSLFLACVAALSNFGLLFLSGWFLAAAAVAGLAGQVVAQTFNVMLPSAGVRFFAISRILARYLERIVTHDGALRLTSLLRSWTYARLAPQAPADLLDVRGGDLLGRFVTETDQITGWYTDSALPVLRALLCGIIYVGVFACALPVAALILACGLGGAALAIWGLTQPVVHQLMARAIKERADLQTDMAETLQSLGESITLGAMPARYHALATRQKRLDRVQIQAAVAERLASGCVTLSMFVTALIVLVYATYALQSGRLLTPELPMLVLGTLAAFDVMTMLPLSRLASATAQIAADRLVEHCGDPDQKPKVKKVVLPQAPYDLQLENVSFGYPGAETLVLNKASLSIKQGERVAIIGPSGIGKSSLINILFGFWPVQEGRVVFGGVDVHEMDAETLSQFVSVAAQDNHLFAGSICDNLRIANPNATESAMMEALETAQLATFVASLPEGLNTLLGNEGVRLSGGQARRLAIAQALLHPTPWLILDEPTQGLDAETEQELMVALLNARPKTTIVCMTHSYAILKFMYRVVCMDGKGIHPFSGEVVEMEGETQMAH